jgi:single-stranded DNA-specific DHH superfamily exonuclease
MDKARPQFASVLSCRNQRLAVLHAPHAATKRLEMQLTKTLPQIDPRAIAYVARQPGASYDSCKRYLQPFSYDELERDVLPAYDSLRDMHAAAKRLAEAVMLGQPIGISGDYDCDGNTSTALMIRFLQESGVTPNHIHVHIPNREREGYGVNRDAVAAMANKVPPVELLLTLDNGTLAHKPLAAAKALGMDAIVIDHHPNSDGHDLPKDVAVVNPRRADEPLRDEPNGVGDMAAVGVTWLICRRAVQILKERGYFKDKPTTPDPRNWLGLVALGTQADVVDISKPLNRALIRQGLAVINEGKDPYISTLARVAQLADPNNITETDISFSLGPIVNAPGRLGQSVAWSFLTPPDATAEPMSQFMQSANAQAVELHAGLKQQRDHLNAMRRDPTEKYHVEDNLEHDLAMNTKLKYPPHQMNDALQKADEALKGSNSMASIDPSQYALMLMSREANNLRKLIEGAVTREARPQARRLLKDKPDTSVLLLHGKGWHEGVVGIVAGRIKEEFNLPTLVASVLPPNAKGEVLCKASARSIKVEGQPVDIGQAVRDMSPEDGVDNPNLLMKKGGGHAMAAGCTFDAANIEAIRKQMDAALKAPLAAAKKAQRTYLAGIVDMQTEDGSTLQQWTNAQQALRPHGEGSRMPLIGLVGAQITPPRHMGRNGNHLEFQILMRETSITAHAFHAAGTSLETALREAARNPDEIAHLLVGTLELPKTGEGRSEAPMPEFKLADILSTPQLKHQTPMECIAQALEVSAQELSGVLTAGGKKRGVG